MMCLLVLFNSISNRSSLTFSHNSSNLQARFRFENDNFSTITETAKIAIEISGQSWIGVGLMDIYAQSRWCHCKELDVSSWVFKGSLCQIHLQCSRKLHAICGICHTEQM